MSQDISPKLLRLLGGTGWASTPAYYELINKRINDTLGEQHSARILLYSINYNAIMKAYADNDHGTIKKILKQELQFLLECKSGGIIICCNTLHKFFDEIEAELDLKGTPVFHAVKLTRDHILEKSYKKILLLATKFTLDDGFFEKTLTDGRISVVTPSANERDRIAKIHANELMHNIVTDESKKYFQDLIEKYISPEGAQAVVVGCTEFPMIVTSDISSVPLINPVDLQCAAAAKYALLLSTT